MCQLDNYGAIFSTIFKWKANLGKQNAWNLQNNTWQLDDKFEIFKSEVEAKERSLKIGTSCVLRHATVRTISVYVIFKKEMIQ